MAMAAVSPDSFAECEYHLGMLMLPCMENSLVWGTKFMDALVRTGLMSVQTREICEGKMSAECTRLFIKDHLIPACSPHGFKSKNYYYFIETLLESRQVYVAERVVNGMSVESKTRRVLRRKLMVHEQASMLKEEFWLDKQRLSHARAHEEAEEYWRIYVEN